MAHFSGAILHTTQFAFTSEAIELAKKKLNPNGLLILAGGSKVNILLVLKDLAKKNFGENIEKSVVILSPNDGSPNVLNSYWDNSIVIWKRGEFTHQEIDQLKYSVKQEYFVLISPFESKSDDISLVVSSKNETANLNFLREKTRIYFDLFTDDRPFIFNPNNPKEFLKWQFWKPYELNRQALILFCLSLIFVIFLVLLIRNGIRLFRPGISCCFSGAVGAGAQILILFKMLRILRIRHWLFL